MEFKIEDIPSGSKYKRDSVNVIISGKISFRDHDEFFDMINGVTKKSYDKYIFDLTNCPSIDSAALGMFVILNDKIKEKDEYAEISLKNPQPKVKNYLYSARFDSLYEIG